MQIDIGPYPMTVSQMAEWSERITQLDPVECAVALQALNNGRHKPGITIRPAN